MVFSAEPLNSTRIGVVGVVRLRGAAADFARLTRERAPVNEHVCVRAAHRTSFFFWRQVSVFGPPLTHVGRVARTAFSLVVNHIRRSACAARNHLFSNVSRFTILLK